MVKNRVLLRLLLISVLFGVTLTVSACYRNAGEDVEPTSNTRVDLSDLQPTTLAPPTQLATQTETPSAAISPTFTLRPTITPADVDPVQATASPTDDAPVVPSATPTDSAAFAPPSFTPALTLTPDSAAITTPGMSDVQPSNTPAPTLDPAFRPTPTDIPPEANPCIHVVQPNDTLYSLARDNEVTVTDLVAANPDVLTLGENTVLQLGWELRIPGCDLGVAEPSEAVLTPGGEMITIAPQTTAVAGEPIQHVVQPGETIYSIGRLYSVDPTAIIALNNLANPNLIKQGQILLIPSQ